MRKWCAIAVIGAILALPVRAQKNGTDESAKNHSEVAASSAASPANSSLPPASRSGFALPATPRPTPFPGPAASAQQDPPGRLLPRYEISALYNYLNLNPGENFNSFGAHGGSGGFAYNASRYLGLVAEVGGSTYERNVTGNQLRGGVTSYLFGPRLNLRRFDHFVPFGEFLVGGTRVGGQFTGGPTQGAFALATGGGVDIVLFKNLAWRFAQIDYLMTNHSGPSLAGNARQNNLRLGTGVVLRFGIPNPPPPPNHPPVAACSASPASVIAGSGDPVAIHVSASDPDNDPLTYSYTATGGAVEGTGPDARFNPSGLAPGTYTVNAKVDDGRGATASCSADVKVEPKPNQPPVISCKADRSPIMPGEHTTITSAASDPDNDPLTYSYTATGGKVTGNGATADFDSTGLQPGSYTVKCAVSDGRGGNAESSANVDVQQPPPPPQATKVGDCGYNKAGASRFDNACKRVGDDVSLRLKNDPSAKLVIVGFADPKEPKAAKLAQTRAALAKKYLGEKGIDASRIATRTGTAGADKNANRRVDFVIVPEGAIF